MNRDSILKTTLFISRSLFKDTQYSIASQIACLAIWEVLWTLFHLTHWYRWLADLCLELGYATYFISPLVDYVRISPGIGRISFQNPNKLEDKQLSRAGVCEIFTKYQGYIHVFKAGVNIKLVIFAQQ